MIKLNGPLLKDLVAQQFSAGVDGLLTEWQSRLPSQKTPDRSTIYRWMSGKLPRSADELLNLCGLLDVDPFCMLAAENVDTLSAIEHLLSSFQMDYWRKPGLKFLRPFLGRQLVWPPHHIAKDHFLRTWNVKQFEHYATNEKNFYGRIDILGDSSVYSNRPQVFHVAFKTPGYFRDRWLEYGMVERYGDQVRLIHINGHNEQYECPDGQDPTRFETWFGESPVMFGVASLHEFTIRSINHTNDGVEVVRFPG